MNDVGLRAVDAFSEACRMGPSLVRDARARQGVGLYGLWNTGSVQDFHLPQTRDLILSLHLSGSRRVRLFTRDGLSRAVSKPGDITVMPHNQPISFRIEGAVNFATLHFASDLSTTRNAEEWSRILKLTSCLFAFRDEYVCASVKALMRATHAPSQGSAKYCSRLFDSLVCHLARLVEENNNESIELPTLAERGMRAPDFDAVLRHIEQQLSAKLTLDELSERAGVSRTTFAREFTAKFGCSPHRFLTQRRIERAKSLLRDGELSFADIAYEVGFSGQSHLSTTFKSLEGCTPRDFVSAVRQHS